MLFGNSPPLTRSLVAKVRAATRRPLIVKLSPNAPDLVESATRGPRGRRRHPLAREHVRRDGDRPGDGEAADLVRNGRALGPGDPAARGADGLPGARRRCPDVPLMGIGGIAELSDVLEFLAAGATAVQVGTANFKDPGVSQRLVRELAEYCEARRTTVRELVGRAHRGGGGRRRRGSGGMSTASARAALRRPRLPDARRSRRHGRAGWRAAPAGSRSGSRRSSRRGPALVARRRRGVRREGLPRPEVPRHPGDGRGRRRVGGALGRRDGQRPRLGRPRDARGRARGGGPGRPRDASSPSRC